MVLTDHPLNNLLLTSVMFSVFLCKEFGEAATMLSATCDEFLKNMCDCMDLAESNFGELL